MGAQEIQINFTVLFGKEYNKNDFFSISGLERTFFDILAVVNNRHFQNK